MKIAMPVNEQSMDSTICISFGRAPFFMIYDTETKSVDFLDNAVAAASPGGAGIKAAQLVVDHQADVLLTPRCGENAAEVFNGSTIKMFKTVGTSIEENLKAFENEQLESLVEIHAGHHHGGK